jgi:hypothetical protein
MRGNFDISVDFSLVTHPAVDNWYVYLDARSISDAGGKPIHQVRSLIMRRYGLLQYGGEIRLNSTPSTIEGTGVYAETTDATGRLRISRTGNQAYTYYWNGTDWVLLQQSETGTADMALYLWISSAIEYPTVAADYDNLVVTADAVRAGILT